MSDPCRARYRCFTGLIAVLVLACLALPMTGSPAAAAQLTSRTAAFTSAVQVIVHTRFGATRRCSGYLFSTQGMVATDYHAITDAQSIQVFQADLGVLDVARIRRVDPRVNIAVLGLAQPLPADQPLAYPADLRDYQPGDVLHVLHHAQYRDELESDTAAAGSGFPVQLGQTGFLKGYAQDAPLIAVDGPFDAGSAGGVVYDADWNVAGVLVGSDAPGPDGRRRAYALQVHYLEPLLRTSYDTSWDQLRTPNSGDAGLFDTYFGPAAPPQDFKAPMDGGYLAWFSPLYPCAYSDGEFTAEINDKISKNWFYTGDLVIDRRPLREWSASRVVVWGAGSNPWGLKDGPERYLHFDADSIFNKRVYKTRETEERIMTRYILAVQLSPGPHSVQYQNKAANFKAVGIARRNLDIQQGIVQLIDIQGLSLVAMDDLPAPKQGIGEGAAVKYDLTRHPLGPQEIGFGIRSNWFKLER